MIDVEVLPAPVKETPTEKVTPLKVSEAMRLGAMVTGPMQNALKGKNQYGEYACAIGAAGVGFGWKRGFYKKFTALTDTRNDYDCPVDDSTRGNFHRPGHYHGTVSDIVVHMNDSHGLPREWIADWLEQQGF